MLTLEGFVTTEVPENQRRFDEYQLLQTPCAQSLTTIHRQRDRNATHLAHLAADCDDVSLRRHTVDVVAPASLSFLSSPELTPLSHCTFSEAVCVCPGNGADGFQR